MDVDLERFEVALPGGVTTVRCKQCGESRSGTFAYQLVYVENWTAEHRCALPAATARK